MTRLLLLLLTAAACDGCDDDPMDVMDSGMACAPGTETCACLEGSTCQGGLVCDEGICTAVVTTRLVVSDPNARSCEAIVVEQDTRLLGVRFEDSVQGTFVREAPRTAVTFHQRTDAALGAGAVTLERAAGVGGSLTLRRARCFDAQGAALDGEPIRIEQ